VLATACIVFAQTSETKPPDVGSEREDNGLSQDFHGGKPADQVRILTDTMGVNFGPYIARNKGDCPQ
jgi:hypothetical protein